MSLAGFVHAECAIPMPENCIVLLSGYRGSIAHGTYIPSTDPNSVDDIDIMHIVVPPLDCYFGLKGWGHRGTKQYNENEYDVLAYELRKFISLLLKSNPNVLSMLFLDDTDYIVMTDWGREIIQQRQIFLSKQAYQSFMGYALGQLKRMTAFRTEGYMGAKRKALVEKFGYDVKNAGHLVRLLRMGIELLKTGNLQVKRPDAEELKEIKTGAWSLEKVKEEHAKLYVKMTDIYEYSPLPDRPDIEAANRLCMRILSDIWNVRE